MKRIRQSLTSCIRKILFRVRVNGESCWPVLVPGKSYWASGLIQVRVGDFIVFKNPTDREQILVKRVREMRGGKYEVGSMVSWGSSSKDFGLVSKKDILGKIMVWNML